MFSIGRLKLKKPLVAATVTDRTGPASVRRLRDKGLDAIEIRVDWFKRLDSGYVLRKTRALKKCGVPVIITVRSRKEGGKRSLTDGRRLGLFRELLGLADGIDIELSSSSAFRALIRDARKSHKTVILSYHDFKKTPSRNALESVIRNARSKGADIVKIAAFAKDIADVVRMMEVTFANRGKRLITMSLGDAGRISRVALPLAGSLITYGFIDRAAAPGQMHVRTLIEELRIYTG